MHPYRTAPIVERPSRVPGRSWLGAAATFIGLACAISAIVLGVANPHLGELAPAATKTPGATVATTESPSPAPRPMSFDVADLVRLDPSNLDLIQGEAVVVRGVLRDRRSDSFGNESIELGVGIGWETPIVQCFLKDPKIATPRAGTEVRMRGRVFGRSPGVAIQLDRCTPLASEPSPSFFHGSGSALSTGTLGPL